MVYQHIRNVEKFSTYFYRNAFVLAEGIDEDCLEFIRVAAESTPLPHAPSRREVRENCQGWTYRVVERLGRDGAVEKGKTEMVGKMVQPILLCERPMPS
jgi:hypothetical protein